MNEKSLRWLLPKEIQEEKKRQLNKAERILDNPETRGFAIGDSVHIIGDEDHTRWTIAGFVKTPFDDESKFDPIMHAQLIDGKGAQCNRTIPVSVLFECD